MKNLCTYDSFRNESVRDRMTPISDEDIRNKLNGLSSDEILQIMYNGPKDELLYKFFTEDEVMKMLGDLRYDRKGIFLRAALGYRDYKFTKMLLDAGADPNLDDCWPMRYVTNWKEKELIELLKEYGGVLEPENIVIKESLRDKMSPVSDDFINDKINSSTQEELIDMMYRSISSNDIDTVKLVLPHISLKDGGKELYDLCEFSVEVGRYKILDILIERITDKGIVRRVIGYMEDYVDDAYLTDLAKGRIAPLIEKYKKLINESFGGDEKMTFVNNTNIKRYNEIGLKSFQKSFSDFISEGVRDKMTPKSEEDINRDLEGKNRFIVFEKACMEGVVDYVRAKVKHYPKVWLGSCLWKACLGGHLDVVEILVENGADIHYLNDIALRYSVRNSHYEIADYLLTRGANPDYKHDGHFRVRDEKMAEIFKKYKGVTKKFETHNESVRDRMTGKSEMEVRDMLERLTPDELDDILVRSVTGNDIEMITLILPHIEFIDNSEGTELCELCVDLYHVKVLELLLQKGIGTEGMNHLISYIEDNIDEETKREKMKKLVRRYESTKNEGFEVDGKTTSVNGCKDVNYGKNSLKSFQSSFSSFVNEGVDKIEPRSMEELLTDNPGFTELYSDVKHWTKGDKSIVVGDMESDIYGSVCYAYFKIVVDGVSPHKFDTYDKSVLQVMCYSDKHIPLLLKKKNTYEWVTISNNTEFTEIIKEMNKLKALHESLRDMMTPKSKDDIRETILQKPEVFLKRYKGFLNKEEVYDIVSKMQRGNQIRAIIFDVPELYSDKEKREAIDKLSNDVKFEMKLGRFRDLYSEEELEEVWRDLVVDTFEKAYKNGKATINLDWIGNRWTTYSEPFKVSDDLYEYKGKKMKIHSYESGGWYEHKLIVV